MKDTSKHDNFLAEAVRTHDRQLSYMDGLRFGFGFFVAGLLVALVLAGLTWALIATIHPH